MVLFQDLWLVDAGLGVQMLQAYAVFMSFLFIASQVLRLAGFKDDMSHWFALHAVANAYITFVTFGDVYNSFKEPDWAVYRPVTANNIDWTNAAMLGSIHLYHMLFYKCNAADWFHHLLFVPFNQLAYFWPHLFWAHGQTWGSAINMQQFFVCGQFHCFQLHNFIQTDLLYQGYPVD
jgi:hypothetical protein